MEPTTASIGKNPRRRPLEICWVSVLAIAHIAYTKSQNLNRPIRSLSRKIFEIALSFSSLVNPIRCHLLAILSLTDDHILALEETIETHFPSSNFVFNKIDEVLRFAETLPGKFDLALGKFPGIINQAVVLDWVLVHAISWLDFFVNVLTHWRDKNTREKEIMVDKSFIESAFLKEETKKTEEAGEMIKPEVKRATYKEALEKGSNIEGGLKNDEIHKEVDVAEGKGCSETNESTARGESSTGKNDPILELFETGWILNPIKRSKGSSSSLTLSRFSSYA